MATTLPARRGLASGEVGLYIATFMAVFDIAVVYLALPSIERAIHATLADQVWSASAYVYIIGVVVFTVASMASGLAPNPIVLICARFIQGIGGAIMMALPLAILCGMVDGEEDTAKTIRMFATIAGMGAVAGPVLGGILISAFGWRAVFFVNVPISLFVLFAAWRYTHESERDPDLRLDLWGQATSILALLAFSFTAIEGNTLGWWSAPIIGSAVVCLASAALFAWIEKHAACPLLRFDVLGDALLDVGTWAMLMMNIGFFTLYLIASLFIQNVRGVDALAAGWLLLSNNALFWLTNQFSAPLSARLGQRPAVLFGLTLGALGLLSFAFFRTTTPAAWIVIPLALTGFGWGLAFTPINTLAMRHVPKNEDGLASGLLNIGRPLGAVFGTAIFGAVLAGTMSVALQRKLEALNASPVARDAISEAVRVSGLWGLSGAAARFGLPTGSLRDALAAGFITGMHISGIAVAAASLAIILYAFAVYRQRDAQN
jgi:DHA2 family methylenomycin A resistance protein-like MFS transporter